MKFGENNVQNVDQMSRATKTIHKNEKKAK